MKQVQELSKSFSEDEKEILQEVMNISFGKAIADLAEVVGVLIDLSVPNVTLVSGEDFPVYLVNKIKVAPPYNSIEQNFSGKLSGHVFMIFPEGSEKKLADLLGTHDEHLEFEDAARLEKGALIEIGNILTGACIGKLVEVLQETVSFTPPRLEMASSPSWQTPLNLIKKESVVISVKTEFKFSKDDIKGYFFLITNDQSIPWFKKALHAFMAQF